MSKPAPTAGVVFLAGDGASTRILYHALRDEFPVRAVVFEGPASRKAYFKNRIKKLGKLTVAGQILFRTGIVPLLERSASRRERAIERAHSLKSDPIDPSLVHHVTSANADETIALLNRLAPAVIVVSGTRILSRKLLTSVPATFINMHAGITPVFRGVHGGYWALATGRPDLCGVTVHVVDPGVDTGTILGQATIAPTAEDNFTTYPLLQLAAGIPLLKKAVRDALAGKLEPVKAPPGESAQWYHPTLWGYLLTRARKGVR